MVGMTEDFITETVEVLDGLVCLCSSNRSLQRLDWVVTLL